MKDFKFLQVILVMIFFILILFSLCDIPSVPLDAETVTEIESTGRDATCLDLIGTWEFMGSGLRWEFRDDGWYKESNTNFFNNDDSGEYSCDDISRIVLVPDTDEYVGTYPFKVQIGKISNGRMVIFLGEKSRTDVIVKQKP